jgi:hypothetical protein
MLSKLRAIGRVAGIFATILGVLFAGYVGLTWNLRVPSMVCLEARFQKLPDNDQSLANWIRSQPNVYKAVMIARHDPDKKRLVVWVPVSFHPWLHTPVPDLDSNVSRFGYLEPDGPFRLSGNEGLSDPTFSDNP